MNRCIMLLAALAALATQAGAVAVTDEQKAPVASGAKTDRLDQLVPPKADRLPLAQGLDSDMPDVATIAIVSGPGHSMAIRVPLMVVSFDYE